MSVINTVTPLSKSPTMLSHSWPEFYQTGHSITYEYRYYKLIWQYLLMTLFSLSRRCNVKTFWSHINSILFSKDWAKTSYQPSLAWECLSLDINLNRSVAISKPYRSHIKAIKTVLCLLHIISLASRAFLSFFLSLFSCFFPSECFYLSFIFSSFPRQ